MEVGVFIVISVAFVYSIFAQRLSTSIITAPMIFLGLGYLSFTSGLLHVEGKNSALFLIAEIALIVVLFSDANQSNLKSLIRNHLWSQRMLLLGLPLMVVIGTLISLPFLPGWPIFAILLVASILAPTDAALGQAVVTSKDVPEHERQALTVESGLNDGLALPVILLFVSLLAANAEVEQHGNFVVFVLEQLLLGPLVGIAIGYMGAKLILWAEDKAYSEPVYEEIATIALALGAYFLAEIVGGNGFIATFVAGLIFGQTIGKRINFVRSFAESNGQIFVWAAFFLIGLELLPSAISSLTFPIFIMILLSLLVARPLAICLSLIGTNASLKTRLFFGWFGPRGLGTALYALLIVDDIDTHYADQILTIAICAVCISAILHGLTAAPFSKLYGKSQIKKP